MELEEVKLRRIQGQHLLNPVASMHVARDLCGLQAQFLRNAVHALRIRTDTPSVAGLVKTWTLRGTVHLLPESDLPLYIRHCGTAEDVCESGWYQWTAGRGHANPPARERELARRMAAAIAEGIDTREALRAHLRDQGMTEAEEERAFNPWGGMIAELANIGVIAFQVDMVDEVHPDETKRYRLLTPFTPVEEKRARVELLRRYLTHAGPVTLRDAAYFFHWTQAEIRTLLQELPVEQAECGKQACYYIPAEEPTQECPPVILLAGFDPLMLSYRKEENPFLPPEHLRGIFNLAGIVNPPILLHGHAAGKWKEKDGKVELTAFETIQPKDKRLIEREAERLFDVKKIIWK
ncbi:MAG: winged helix DNA-binding domain-containing protein [Clostridia bacterium]|nr:winged helix DNA-binding domain-containing protein [Clostridia bacterium]